MKCLICGEEVTEYTSTMSFIRFHVTKEHGLNAREYYDQYVKVDGEDECKCGCGRPTKFLNFAKGYREWYSRKCYVDSGEYSKDIKKSFETRDTKAEAVKRKDTCLEKYGVEHISQLEETKQKVIATNMVNCGHSTNLKTKECHDVRWKSLNDNMDIINKKRSLYWTDEAKQDALDKRKKTCLDKYDVENVFQLDDVKDYIRQANVDNGVWIDEAEYSEFYRFYNDVRNLSRKYYAEIYDQWDGYDYYTGEYLLNDEGVYDDIKYKPTIDHKTSIHYGYHNNIPIEVLSSKENLCVCRWGINSQKNIMCEDEFRQKLIDRGVIDA